MDPVKMEKLRALEQLHEMSQDSIYMVGAAFMMGSLFTIFLLVVMDLMRALREEREMRRTLLNDEE